MATQQDLRTLVDRFVSDLSVLVHQDALDAVRAALGEGPAQKRRGPGRPRKAAKRGPGRPKAAKRGPGRPRKKATKKAGRPRKPGRRSQEDVAALGETVLAHVRSNPGQRLEELGRELGMPTKELKRPIANLMEAGKLRTEGQKRGTMYFAGGREGPRRKGTKKKTAGRRKTTSKKATKRKTAKSKRKAKKAGG